MSEKVGLLFLLIGFSVWLVACDQGPDLPTRLPTAAAPTQPPPSVTPRLSPTHDFGRPTDTPVSSPTAIMPTPEPTVTSTSAEPAVNITSPNEGTEFVLGSQVVIGGLAQLAASQSLSVTLISATGHTLAVAPGVVSEFNSWQANFSVPPSVTGPAQVQAAIRDSGGEVVALDVLPVNLALDVETADRYVTLFRPLNGEKAVAGFNLFFDGRFQRPVNSTVTISLWNEGCRNQLARQSFVMRGSRGYWQGFLIVPRDVVGLACAVAHFGTPGEEGWREAQVVVDVLPASDADARGVLIGNPPPGDITSAGESLLLYGTAYNAPDGEVLVSILLENGRVLTEGVATADLFGYWELSLFIPENAEGPAQINASLGQPSEEDYAQTQNRVTIQPAEEE